MIGCSMLLPLLVLLSTVLHSASAHSSQLTHILFTGKSILGRQGQPVSVTGFITHACKPGEGHCSPVKHAHVDVFLQPGSVGRLHPHKPVQRAAPMHSALRSLKSAPIMAPSSKAAAAAAAAPITKLTATTDASGMFTVYVGSKVPGHTCVNASTTVAGQVVFAESLVDIRWTQDTAKAAHTGSPSKKVPHPHKAAATHSSAGRQQHTAHSSNPSRSAAAHTAATAKSAKQHAKVPFSARSASISLGPRFQEVCTTGVANMTATVFDASWQPVTDIEVHFMCWRINTEDSFMGPQPALFGDSAYALELGDANASRNSTAVNDAVVVKSAFTDNQGKAQVCFNSSTPGQVSVIASVQGSMTMSQPAMVAWLDGDYAPEPLKVVQHRATEARPQAQKRKQAKHMSWLAKSKKARRPAQNRLETA